MKKIKFIRSTHDRYGKFKQDIGYIVGSLSAYVHMLDREPKSLDDVIAEVRKYNKQFPDATYDSDPAFIALALIRMLEVGMIELKNEQIR